MTSREDLVEIPVGPRQLAGTIVSPTIAMEGMLFVHGWAGNQQQYLVRAREIAALGCVCLTFDLHGHARTAPFQTAVTREDNLQDVLAAYDLLVDRPHVNKSAIGVIGSSYGGYLAALLSSLRPVQWLALRAPALYKDENWDMPKSLLNREELVSYRRSIISSQHNRALKACSVFQGDVLLVESEHDTIVPSSVTANYRTAFQNARSLTFRVIEGADHALSDESWQKTYTALLTNWTKDLILAARKAAIQP
jgi:dienelactone hydrolase